MRAWTGLFLFPALAHPAIAQSAFFPLAGTNAGTPAGPAAISADGRIVVGWSQLAPGQGLRAIRWTLPSLSPENLTPTWPAGGASNTEATAVSADGSTIVGYRQNSTPAHGFALLSPPGTLDNLPELSTASWPRALSADGRIIVGSGGAEGILRWFDRTPSPLGYPAGASSASAAATTPDGGAWVGYGTFAGVARPILWTPAALYTDLGVPTGFASAKATGITAHATIVGTATRANQFPQGWTRGADGAYSMLVGPRGEAITQALAVTPDGRVIVGAYVPTTPLLYDPCIWVDGVCIDIKSTLAAAGINLNGWELDSVLDVSDDGTMITGMASTGGQSRAWAARLVLPPRCDPDFNTDGNVDQDDIAYLSNVIAGGLNPSGRDPDFNHDGNVDQDDYRALVDVVAGAACP